MTASSAGAALADWTTSRWSAVVVPWLVSRGALFVVAQRAADLRSKPGGLAAFAVWDGPWYADIARYGYGWAHSNGETPYPFFPLLPAVLRFGIALGFDPIAFGVVVNHLVFLIALAGVYEIARVHFGPLTAGLAVWSLALFPGSAPLTMAYPDPIFLACAVFACATRRAAHARRMLAAIARIARPGGSSSRSPCAGDGARGPFLAPDDRLKSPLRRRRRRVDGVALTQTGDPLIFLHAKAAWHEITVALAPGGAPFPGRRPAPLRLRGAGLPSPGRPRSLARLARGSVPSASFQALSRHAALRRSAFPSSSEAGSSSVAGRSAPGRLALVCFAAASSSRRERLCSVRSAARRAGRFPTAPLRATSRGPDAARGAPRSSALRVLPLLQRRSDDPAAWCAGSMPLLMRSASHTRRSSSWATARPSSTRPAIGGQVSPASRASATRDRGTARRPFADAARREMASTPRRCSVRSREVVHLLGARATDGSRRGAGRSSAALVVAPRSSARLPPLRPAVLPAAGARHRLRLPFHPSLPRVKLRHSAASSA